MSTFSLNDHQLGVAEVHHNLSASSFYEQPRKTQLPPSWLSSVCIEKGQSPLQAQCVSPDRQSQLIIHKCLRRHTTFPRIQARAVTGEENGSLSWALLF